MWSKVYRRYKGDKMNAKDISVLSVRRLNTGKMSQRSYKSLYNKDKQQKCTDKNKSRIETMTQLFLMRLRLVLNEEKLLLQAQRTAPGTASNIKP